MKAKKLRISFVSLVLNTLTERKDGRIGRLISEFNIILTTPSCFPATWNIIHEKTRWKLIDWGNKWNFSCMFVIHPGRAAICALFLCVCVVVWKGPRGHIGCLVSAESFSHYTVTPFDPSEMSLSSKYCTLQEKLLTFSEICLFALKLCQMWGSISISFLCMPYRDWSRMCSALLSSKMWAGVNSCPPTNPKLQYIHYKICYVL